jgi:hypothetical protein
MEAQSAEIVRGTAPEVNATMSRHYAASFLFIAGIVMTSPLNKPLSRKLGENTNLHSSIVIVKLGKRTERA